MSTTKFIDMPFLKAAEQQRAELSGRYVSAPATNKTGVDCYIRLPKKLSEDSPVVVAVHGIARNPLQQLIHFSAYAEQHDALLIAPYFDKKKWHGYQQLICRKARRRSDMALIESVERIQKGLALPVQPFYLFGFSGGGQFAHRFTMFHPDKVHAIASAAAGWYTMPDYGIQFPLGLATHGTYMDKSPDMTKFMEKKILILVGQGDTKIDKSLNQDQEITAIQGLTRVDRAEQWVGAIRAFGQHKDQKIDITAQFLPELGHSFRQCMVEGRIGSRVCEFFFTDDGASEAGAEMGDEGIQEF